MGLWGGFTGKYLVEGPGGLGKQGGFKGTATWAPWQIPAWSGAGEDNLGSLSVKGCWAGALAWDSGPWCCSWLPVTRGPPLTPSVPTCKLQGELGGFVARGSQASKNRVSKFHYFSSSPLSTLEDERASAVIPGPPGRRHGPSSCPARLMLVLTPQGQLHRTSLTDSWSAGPPMSRAPLPGIHPACSLCLQDVLV